MPELPEVETSKRYIKKFLLNAKIINIQSRVPKLRWKINPDLKMSVKILPQNDPLRRRPSIEKAKNELHWEPKTSLNIGLDKTIQYFKNNFSELNN